MKPPPMIAHAICGLGFTLLELLVTLAVGSVAVLLGAPAMRSVLLNAQRDTSVHALVAAVELARSEAAKRGREVVLCQSSDGQRCTGAGDYSAGWIVFVNDDGTRPIERSADETLLRADSPATSGAFLGNRALFEFRPFLERSTNGTVTFCDPRGAEHSRAVVVSYTGRPRIAARDSRGRALACPE